MGEQDADVTLLAVRKETADQLRVLGVLRQPRQAGDDEPPAPHRNRRRLIVEERQAVLSTGLGDQPMPGNDVVISLAEVEPVRRPQALHRRQGVGEIHPCCG